VRQSFEIIVEDLAKNRIRSRLDLALRRAPQVAAFLGSITQSRKTWAIVGGAPRMWATNDPEEPRDIDIVVGGSSDFVDRIVRSSLQYSLRDDPIDLSRTKLGGYRLRTHQDLFDVWPAESSVGLARTAISQKNLYRRVARSAALSIDSLVYTNRGALYEHGFFETFSTGVMKLNHCHVERPEVMARKALVLCSRYRLIPELSLQVFVTSTLGEPFTSPARTPS
jgi:hypothetical protein